MLKNYLITTFQYLQKHKTFSVINVVGLTLGLTVSFFALLYVNFELSYDSYHDNADHIYRVVTDVKSSTGIDYRGSAVPLAPAIQEAFPEIKAATRTVLDYLIIQKEGGDASEEKIAYADSSFFSVFTFPFVSGNPDKALNVPFNIVLSESSAKKYFGDTDPIGKMLLINGKDRAYVTGVMTDIPHNSHFRVDMLVSLSTLLEVWNPDMATRWISARASTYLLLHNNVNVSSLQKQFPSFVGKHYDQHEFQYTLLMEPLKDVYLYGKPRGSRSGSAITGNPDNIYILSVVAGFVLLIAAFNFVNLTTAFSLQRAKEIGVRKVLGASRSQLILQFLSDAILLSVGACFLSIVLVILLMPAFQQLSGKEIDFGIARNIKDIGWFVLLAVTIGLLSGIYPAIFLSGFKPINSLKGKLISPSKGIGLRRSLVLSQFSISIILVVGTLVVFQQLYFMQTQELGFKKDHRMVIDFQFDNNVKKHAETIKNQLTSLPGVADASISSCIPGRSNHKLDTEIENADHMNQASRMDAYFVDHDFFHQYEIEMIAGRPFSNEITTDSTEAMIVNEASVKSLGYHRAEEAIGKKFAQWGRKGFIIGVVRDFHFQSFREEVQPLTFQMGDMATFLSLTVSNENLAPVIVNIERKWNQVAGGVPMTYFFADEAYDAQYVSEARFGKLFLSFAVLAIVLSCLGLVGLSAFSTAQRTKEIGIRKVLGSSVAEIMGLLSKDFLVLMMVAAVIAVPVSWYSMNRWLEGFAYRINISWWLFALAGITVALVAFATIGYQTLKAAYANPARSLKSE
ncbi:MAG TPA: FtsX-like permease family protein [Chryseolinea sp.]|nr:FtsX-like permease family protein [Chryseolinea sp.]